MVAVVEEVDVAVGGRTSWRAGGQAAGGGWWLVLLLLLPAALLFCLPAQPTSINPSSHEHGTRSRGT